MKKATTHIYGNQHDYWLTEMRKGLPPKWTPGRDRLLCQNQSRNHSRGFREAMMVETIFGYSIRMASGLDDRMRLFGGRMMGRTVSYEEALEWGKTWVDKSPDFRVLVYGDKCQGCCMDYHVKEGP